MKGGLLWLLVTESFCFSLKQGGSTLTQSAKVALSGKPPGRRYMKAGISIHVQLTRCVSCFIVSRGIFSNTFPIKWRSRAARFQRFRGQGLSLQAAFVVYHVHCLPFTFSPRITTTRSGKRALGHRPQQAFCKS